MELYKTPQILILHLKRFHTSKISSIGSFYYESDSSKIDINVKFPFDLGEIKKYLLDNTINNYDYELFAVINHYGMMHGGHYTAYAYNSSHKTWFDYNDSHVTKVNDIESVISKEAYVLFYKRKFTQKRD